jgi:hypothetical protein
MSGQTSLSGLRVLVAEDEFLVADDNARALRAQGQRCGEGFLSTYTGAPIDLGNMRSLGVRSV